MKKHICTLFAALAAGCAKLPEGMVPVSVFEVQRYLGIWHETARLDYSF